MKNIMKRFLLLCILLCMLPCILSCKKNISNDVIREQEAFETFLDEVFCTLTSSDTLTLNYTLANPSNYNINIAEPTLGEFTLDAKKELLAKEKEYYKQMQSFHYDNLTKAQQMTYDIMEENFKLDNIYESYLLYNEVLGPTTGLQAQLPILLAEYNFNKRDDIEDYLALIKDMKRYFNQICEFEEIKSKAGLFMSDNVADEIIKQCSAFIENVDHNYLIEYFNEKLDSFPSLTDTERSVYKEINQNNIKEYVIPAYEELIATLTNLKGTGRNSEGLCNYKNGKSYYEYLVTSMTGSEKSVNDIASMIDNALSTSLLEMASYIQTDSSILDKLNNYEYISTKPEEILEYLKKNITTDFPALPEVNCTIKYVHESLQDYVSPAMYLIPPLDNYKENSIYINSNPMYNLSEIFTTIAHEGYPGHLYQCVYFRSKDIHPIRNTISYLGYDEGWATYAEMYSYGISGLDPSVAGILKSNMVATHCIYSRTDIGIHYEGWNYQDVSNYLCQFVSEESCKLIYNTLLEEPALYLPYCIGYLEILELKEVAQEKLGKDFNLKEFHTFLLDCGPASFGIIKGAMEEWIAAQ